MTDLKCKLTIEGNKIGPRPFKVEGLEDMEGCLKEPGAIKPAGGSGQGVPGREETDRYKSYIKYLPVVEAIERLIKENRPLIIAIDGRCGSGKSSLASFLADVFDCNIFHMDDFFLPFEMKTQRRLAEPGGNVHYERFREEVLKPLQNREDVSFQPYSCSEGRLGEATCVKFKNLNIIEGVYSLNPTLQGAYDYKIFLTLDPKVQRERILDRSGEEMLQSFIDRWIPLEEYYFSVLNIQAQCDLVVDTTIL